jgi:hypothetical protein
MRSTLATGALPQTGQTVAGWTAGTCGSDRPAARAANATCSAAISSGRVLVAQRGPGQIIQRRCVQLAQGARGVGQWRRQRGVGQHRGQQAAQRVAPGRVQRLRRIEHGHAVGERARQQRGVERHGRCARRRVGLRVDQQGDEAQVVAQRMLVGGELAQPARAIGEQRGGLGEADAREIDAVERLDLAGLEDALQAGLLSDGR